MTRVLALDLASVLGFAAGSTEGTPVSHGIHKLPKTGDDIGWFASDFDKWLNEALDDLEPDEIVFESPILPSTTALATVRKLSGLAWHTEFVARTRKILVTEASLQEIRKHFIGVGAAPKDIKDARVRRMWLKQKTIEECRRRGFRVSGDDDADAIALLSLRLSQLDANYSLNATPLFNGTRAA